MLGLARGASRHVVFRSESVGWVPRSSDAQSEEIRGQACQIFRRTQEPAIEIRERLRFDLPGVVSCAGLQGGVQISTVRRAPMRWRFAHLATFPLLAEVLRIEADRSPAIRVAQRMRRAGEPPNLAISVPSIS